MDHYIATANLMAELLKLAGVIGGPLITYWVTRRLIERERKP